MAKFEISNQEVLKKASDKGVKLSAQTLANWRAGYEIKIGKYYYKYPPYLIQGKDWFKRGRIFYTKTGLAKIASKLLIKFN